MNSKGVELNEGAIMGHDMTISIMQSGQLSKISLEEYNRACALYEQRYSEAFRRMTSESQQGA